MTRQNKHQMDAERYNNRRQIRHEWAQLGLIISIFVLLISIAALIWPAVP